MAAYKQTSRWNEDGFGEVTDVFIVADTFAALSDLAAAIEVNVFQIDGTKSDLDIENGVFLEDELSFKMSGAAAQTTDDIDAIDFVRAAADPATPRFCARLINPHTTVAVEDFDFRGVVRPNMKSKDLHWSDDQFGGAIVPLRDWDCSAGSFDIQTMLSAKMSYLLEHIDTGWITANVADMPGPFYREAGVDSFGKRELRFASLVDLGVLIQKLLDLAAPSGITVSLVTSVTDLDGYPCRFNMVTSHSGAQLRYVNQFHDYFRVYDDDTYRMQIGGTGLGTIYTSWHMMAPAENDKQFSWLRYDSLADMLYAVALSLGMYVHVSYTSPTAVSIKFESRSALIKTEIVLRDAISAERNLTNNHNTESKNKFSGAATPLLGDGWTSDRWDGGGFVTRRSTDAIEAGELLALTIGANCALLGGTGEDAGVNWAENVGSSMLPHNAIFWDGTARKPQATPGNVQYNLEGLHSAIYIHALGRPDADGEVGVDGRDVYLPIARVRTSLYGEDRIFDRLMDYVNARLQTDGLNYFNAEYSIQVPYICSFRDTPTGTSDWRILQRGSVIVLDSIEYVVVGIERKNQETGLKLHAASRFLFIEPASNGSVPAPPSLERDDSAFLKKPVVISSFPVIESIATFDAVSITDEGLERSKAHHSHYGRVIGIALGDAEPGESVQVQTAGRVNGMAALDLPIAARLYVRTGTPNVSTDLLTARTDPEDMIQVIGYMDTDDSMVVRIEPAQVFYPPLT